MFAINLIGPYYWQSGSYDDPHIVWLSYNTVWDARAKDKGCQLTEPGVITQCGFISDIPHNPTLTTTLRSVWPYDMSLPRTVLGSNDISKSQKTPRHLLMEPTSLLAEKEHCIWSTATDGKSDDERRKQDVESDNSLDSRAAPVSQSERLQIAVWVICPQTPSQWQSRTWQDCVNNNLKKKYSKSGNKITT